MDSDIFEFKIKTRPSVFDSHKTGFKLVSRVTTSGLSQKHVKQLDVQSEHEHCEGLKGEKPK